MKYRNILFAITAAALVAFAPKPEAHAQSLVEFSLFTDQFVADLANSRTSAFDLALYFEPVAASAYPPIVFDGGTVATGRDLSEYFDSEFRSSKNKIVFSEFTLLGATLSGDGLCASLVGELTITKENQRNGRQSTKIHKVTFSIIKEQDTSSGNSVYSFSSFSME